MAIFKRFSRRDFGLALMALLAASCTGSKDATEPASGSKQRLKIVTTVGMVTDIVKQVVGERADVVGLLGEGTDPHLYTPGRDDVAQIMAADVVIYSGLMLEGNLERVLESAAKKKKVFAVTEVLSKDFLRSPPEFEGHPDPHVWMAPTAWSECVGFIASKLSEIDSAGAAEYRKNAESYQQQIAELDAYVKKIVATIPEKSRYLVTAHDAFGYFARTYGFEVKSAQGISTQSEAAVADINALVEFLVTHDISALFVESSVSPKNMEAVIEGCRSRGKTIKKGAELFSDAMGAPGTYEGTYLGMIDHNATHIVRALGGDAPARGWQSKLAASE